MQIVSCARRGDRAKSLHPFAISLDRSYVIERFALCDKWRGLGDQVSTPVPSQRFLASAKN